jgi:hypothetical protein
MSPLTEEQKGESLVNQKRGTGQLKKKCGKRKTIE